jgi:hypothetical protein
MLNGNARQSPRWAQASVAKVAAAVCCVLVSVWLLATGTRGGSALQTATQCAHPAAVPPLPFPTKRSCCQFIMQCSCLYIAATGLVLFTAQARHMAQPQEVLHQWHITHQLAPGRHHFQRHCKHHCLHVLRELGDCIQQATNSCAHASVCCLCRSLQSGAANTNTAGKQTVA